MVLGRKLGALPIGLGGLVLWVVAAALAVIWYYTLGLIFRKLADLSIPTGIVGHIHPLGFLKKADHDVRVWLNDAQKYGERGMIWGFTNFAMFFVLLGAAAFVLGEAIFELGEWTTSYVAKALRAHAATRVLPLIPPMIARQIRSAAQAIPKLGARVHALEARVTALATATAGAIAHPIPRIGQLEREVAEHAKRLRKAEKALAGVGAAALVLTALKRLGLGWLRCSNVGKTGKAVCGLNPSVLEALLLEAATLTIAFNLEDFAEQMQAVTQEAADVIHNWAT